MMARVGLVYSVYHDTEIDAQLAH